MEGKSMTRGGRVAGGIMMALLALAFISCGRSSGSERVILPPTPVLSIRSTWAVVKSPLLRIRDQPSGQSTVLAHIRMGAVVEVISKSDKKDTVENDTSYWYRVNYEGLKGWVFGTYISIFDTRSKADAFAASLK
jgi:uncharacterized protein YgiM (DUF1202 family)